MAEDAPGATAEAPEPKVANETDAWVIRHAAWSEAHEAGFADFIQALGRSNCASFDACLESDANPYRDTDDYGSFQGDCADLPYFLRGYYAWKNGLPFSYQEEVEQADGASSDARYSAAGNIVAARRSAAPGVGDAPVSAPSFLRDIHGEVSTAMFRIRIDHEPADPSLFDDFYPIEISREAIRPGVLAYDVFGHAGIVYDVTEDGRILLMASHPNYAITRTVYGQNFQRADPRLGGGLKAWRPQTLENATVEADGSLSGGDVVAAANAALQDYSLEQYFGSAPDEEPDWTDAVFLWEGDALPYYDYVRRKLAAPGFAYDPIAEIRQSVASICKSVEARARAVDRAGAEGVPLMEHPETLPPNIFGATGLWERHATPARDARIKVQFVELRELTEFLITRHRAGDSSVAYDGKRLVADMLETFEASAQSCNVSYLNGAGAIVELSLGDVMERLFDLSFDPYQCAERRWGARGAELATCDQPQEKADWYEALRYLRNQTARDLSMRTDFARDAFQSPAEADALDGGVGWASPPDADIRLYLQEALPAR